MEETIEITDLKEICTKLNLSIAESSNEETIIFSQAEHDEISADLFFHNYLPVN